MLPSTWNASQFDRILPKDLKSQIVINYILIEINDQIENSLFKPEYDSTQPTVFVVSMLDYRRLR